MRFFYALFIFVASLVFCKEVEIENISQKPIFADILHWNALGSEKLCKIIDPLLKKHLKETNYDRLNLVLQYIHHHNAICEKNPVTNPLETLESFEPDLSLGELHGSSCFGLNIDLLLKLPKDLSAYPIPATLFSYSQQPYWPILSHIALVIPFYNPQDPKDKGYVLLDPHLKMESPLVITLSGNPQLGNLKEKGVCTFSYEEDHIISKSPIDSNGNNFSMTYYLTEFTNFIEAGLKPILAADRKITLYSRTEYGEVIASIILLLDANILQYRLPGNPIKEISFVDFISHQTSLENSLADGLHIEKEQLSTLIEKILLHKNLLDDLYHKYTDFIETSQRTSDFYIPI